MTTFSRSLKSRARKCRMLFGKGHVQHMIDSWTAYSCRCSTQDPGKWKASRSRMLQVSHFFQRDQGLMFWFERFCSDYTSLLDPAIKI